MATSAQLEADALVIKNETVAKANTALRVGTWLESAAQSFANKTEAQTISKGWSFTPNFAAASGIDKAMRVHPVIDQSATAGYTALEVDVTENSLGSGQKYLVNIKQNGGVRFSMGNDGIDYVVSSRFRYQDSQLQLYRGVDLPSASELVIETNGNYFRVTGVQTINTMSNLGFAGVHITLEFTSALQLTHSANDLVLPGGANIITATGDVAVFVLSYVNFPNWTWRCISYTRADGTPLVNPAAAHIADGSIHFTQAAISITASQVSDFNIAYNRANHTGTQTLATISDAGTAAALNTGLASGNIPVLQAGGKLHESVIPALAVSEYISSFADLATALADPGVQASQRGDWFNVDDDGSGSPASYFVTTDNPTLSGHVTKINSPTGGVTTLAALTDVATLTANGMAYWNGSELRTDGPTYSAGELKITSGAISGRFAKDNLYLTQGGNLYTLLGSNRFSTPTGVAGAELVGVYDLNNTREALSLLATSVGNDTGAVPIMTFTSSIGAAVVTNRPLSAEYNYTTKVHEVLADGSRDYQGNTLKNARVEPNVQTIASAATVTPDATIDDMVEVTALAVNLTINAPSGAISKPYPLLLQIKDDGTSRTLTWNVAYREIGTVLPSATTAGKLLYVSCIYNAAAAKWDVIGVTEEL